MKASVAGKTKVCRLNPQKAIYSPHPAACAGPKKRPQQRQCGPAQRWRHRPPAAARTLACQSRSCCCGSEPLCTRGVQSSAEGSGGARPGRMLSRATAAGRSSSSISLACRMMRPTRGRGSSTILPGRSECRWPEPVPVSVSLAVPCCACCAPCPPGLSFAWPTGQQFCQVYTEPQSGALS